jgi:hypothetical protein
LLMTSYMDPNIFKQQDNELSLCELHYLQLKQT